jgi:cytidine deaminase
LRHAASDAGDIELLRAAQDALRQAYSPYSKLRVGAALRARDGRVFTGCNVENASFGLTSCAERTALVKAISEGAREFDVIAITTDGERTLMPCGACRQMLSEFAPSLRILVAGPAGTRRESSLEALLPDAFGPSDMP